MIRMKKAVEKEGLSKHWLCQPVGFRTADAGKEGFENLPECSLGKSFTLEYQQKYVAASAATYFC